MSQIPVVNREMIRNWILGSRIDTKPVISKESQDESKELKKNDRKVYPFLPPLHPDIIDATHLRANAIDATHLRANAIDATHLRANAIDILKSKGQSDQ
jgi:hypothetical protein